MPGTAEAVEERTEGQAAKAHMVQGSGPEEAMKTGE